MPIGGQLWANLFEPFRAHSPSRSPLATVPPMTRTSSRPLRASAPEPGLAGLPRDELQRELREIESALTKARTNLELARVDLSRWALLLERAEGLTASIDASTAEGREAHRRAELERSDILAMQRVAHLRFAGCTASIEALVRVEHTVRARLARAGDGPRASGILRRVDTPDADSNAA